MALMSCESRLATGPGRGIYHRYMGDTRRTRHLWGLLPIIAAGSGRSVLEPLQPEDVIALRQVGIERHLDDSHLGRLGIMGERRGMRVAADQQDGRAAELAGIGLELELVVDPAVLAPLDQWRMGRQII